MILYCRCNRIKPKGILANLSCPILRLGGAGGECQNTLYFGGFQAVASVFARPDLKFPVLLHCRSYYYQLFVLSISISII